MLLVQLAVFIKRVSHQPDADSLSRSDTSRETEPTMSAIPFENLTGFSPRFVKKGHNRRFPARMQKHIPSPNEKWCRNCESYHGPGLCQYPIVQMLMDEGLVGCH
jgi:hypothetical protein